MPRAGRLSSPAHSELKIRKARLSDADALARLEEAIFPSDRMSRRRFAVLCRRPSACMLVACRAGEIVGYAILLTRRNIRSARLYSVAVAPQAAGQGIGRRLLAEMEAAARRRRARRLHLEVREDNKSAIRLYEQSGYGPIGRRPDYYSDGTTALLYARDLPPATRPRAAPVRRAA